ncbi:Oxidored-FMN domain-containing protein [Mycena indigotica]|uniref:Oxidored-FMN domain-containing protein n=1 Tax=Mycena indigotica TaxID=2126181 RepID=A0A8H6SRB1_9AGAR|nr:Oxidored-FMN domain-containing protein [Mycena indigotica]KAF7303472.1 Oxidored-FMN domain-containing protein [Mycena indigotica]
MAAKSLLTPVALGSTTLRNRIGMSALTRSRASGTVPNDVMREYYVQRARGGAGLIISEGVLITQQGTEWPEAPGIWSQAQIDGWKNIVDAVHAEGSKIYAQLWHLGRLNHPAAPEQIAAGVPVYGPSAIMARGGRFRHIPGVKDYVVPTELPDPKTIIALYKQAALNAKAAGFDGVEMHGANGYLIHQFLDSSANQRTDSYGGSPKNRTRFALEAVAAAQEVFGADVSIKLSPTGGNNDLGMPLPETVATFGHLLQQLEALPTKLAYVAFMRYNPLHDPIYPDADGKTRATQFDVITTFKPYLKQTPLWANSALSLEEALAYVADGTAAGVFFGLNWIAHPDLVKRIEHGKPLDNQIDFAHLYGAEGVDPALGYTDYKTAAY